jgi:serine/threonine protein kinase
MPVIGQTVSRYKLFEKIGGGGMGIVNKARDLKLDHTVALRPLSPDLTRDATVKRRFAHEASHMLSLPCYSSL